MPLALANWGALPDAGYMHEETRPGAVIVAASQRASDRRGDMSGAAHSVDRRKLQATVGCTTVENGHAEIPASVTTIDANDFRDCATLTTVSLPASLRTIGSEAFRNSGLTALPAFPDNVTSIHSTAFKDCTD
eukprot:COSAG02_NODE_22277_length_757_cov_4.626140_1_plen_132_part_01